MVVRVNGQPGRGPLYTAEVGRHHSLTGIKGSQAGWTTLFLAVDRV